MLLLDFHVVYKGVEKPKKKNYDQIVLGPVKILNQLIDLIHYYPLYLNEKNLGTYVSFDTKTKTALLKPKFGGLMLRYNEKDDRVIFLDIEGNEWFSLPLNIVQYNLLNALIDLQNGFAKASRLTESEINNFLRAR